jgi:hypothetical protein
VKYTAPSGYDFEIPDEWLDEAGVRGVRLSRNAYAVSRPPAGIRGEASELALDHVLTSLDNRPSFDAPGPFSRRRMIQILKAVRDGVSLPPVWVWPIKSPTDRKAYQLFEGHHRYHACVALGLMDIPALVIPRDKPYEPPPGFPCGCGGKDRSCAACIGTGMIEWP